MVGRGMRMPVVALSAVAWLSQLEAQGATPSDPELQAREAEYYRIADLELSASRSASRDPKWKPGDDRALEVTGLDTWGDGRLIACTRKGDVWLIDGAYGDSASLRFRRFASALHEPMGVLRWKDSALLVQRSELTRLRDTNRDEKADEYLTAAKGWNVSGNYHEYAFGPEPDGTGRLWLTLNIGIGELADNRGAWRGWGMMLDASAQLRPMCAGMRSPSGLGANAAGDVFYTDQQGNWMPTCPLHHLRPGVFYGNAQALGTFDHPDAPFRLSGSIPAGKPYPDAIRELKELVPPAVWMPYHKAGESSTDVLLDDTEGKFGPFGGQLFVGDFRSALMTRVFLEKIDGEYQGAVFPFRRGFASAVVRMCFGEDGSMFVGLTNRGWTSVGAASYGLQRLRWSGKTPFEILEMRAVPEGFELVFTKRVDAAAAGNLASYRMKNFTYRYHAAYGGDEILTEANEVTRAEVSGDRLRVRLHVDGRRAFFVHEIRVDGVRSVDGEPLLHRDAYYTLNSIPKGR